MDLYILTYIAKLTKHNTRSRKTVSVFGFFLITGGHDGALGIKNESHVAETKTTEILFDRRRTGGGRATKIEQNHRRRTATNKIAMSRNQNGELKAEGREGRRIKGSKRN